MATTSVNGSLIKKMIINGAINLKNCHKEVDELNVFPVPDGDTGTNMSMTMMSGVREITNTDTNSITDICKIASRGFLMGARGNSGVILSQFFRGVYLGMKQIQGSEATVEEFINCLVSGYLVAYKAVMTPVEGTILTVMRESGEFIDATRAQYKDVESVMKAYLQRAQESLDNTPNILPVLKEAGVVDSGGCGFIRVMEGMELALLGQMLELAQEGAPAQAKVEAPSKFTYCMDFEVILKDKETFDIGDLRSPLSIIGDSLSIKKTDGLAIVHLNTNAPGRALNLGQKYGEFKSIKIENMKLEKTEEKPVEETKPEEKPAETVKPVDKGPKKKYALIAVCFGDGIKKTFEELGVDYIIDGGQTMNPSTEDFVKAVNELNAENYIIIPNNSNIIMAAEQTTKIIEDANIRVLKTKTIAHGYSSLMMFDESNSLDQNVEDMQAAISNVNAGEVTFAVRDTEIKGVKINNGDFMGILNGNIISSVKTKVEASKTILDASVTEDSAVVTVFYGKDATQEEVDEITAYVATLNDCLDVEVIEGGQDIYSFIFSIE